MGANSHINYALRKNGQQEITPIHAEFTESLADILDTSYGLIIYQEQVMAIAQRVAGFSLGQADILRRAMGKKKKSELDKQFEGFEAGMHANGYSDAAVQMLWEILLPFSDYAFNKAHSAAYGMVSYWTAYLKAHYPAEYMAALLTSVGDSKDKMAVYLNECRRMGIKVLPPDVGQSIRYFAAVGEDIRFGLGAVRNVGTNVVDGIVASRARRRLRELPRLPRRRSPSTSRTSAPSSRSSRRARSTRSGPTRRALMEIHEDATEAAVETKRKAATGAIGFDFDSLYDEAEEVMPAKVPDRPEWTKKDKLAFEREMLGLYVSDHPLAGLEIPLAKHASTSIHDLLASEDVSRRRPGHRRGARDERPAPRREVQRQPVRHDHGRGLRRRGHRHVHGQDLHRVPVDAAWPTRSSSCAAGSRAATTGSTCTRSRPSRPISATWRSRVRSS